MYLPTLPCTSYSYCYNCTQIAHVIIPTTKCARGIRKYAVGHGAQDQTDQTDHIGLTHCRCFTRYYWPFSSSYNRFATKAEIHHCVIFQGGLNLKKKYYLLFVVSQHSSTYQKMQETTSSLFGIFEGNRLAQINILIWSRF